MYDFYPEWGYAHHRPSTTAVDEARDEDGERPDDN
jgi:hypothetical protein